MLLVTFSFYLLAVLFLVISIFTSLKVKQKLHDFSYFTANDLCYMLMVFLTPNILTAILIELH